MPTGVNLIGQCALCQPLRPAEQVPSFATSFFLIRHRIVGFGSGWCVEMW